jgi:hypothetical protein
VRSCYLSSQAVCNSSTYGEETRAKGKGKVEPETSESHAYSYNEVRSPSANCIVVDRKVEGEHVNLVLGAVTSIRIVLRVLVPQRFRNTKDKEANGHTSSDCALELGV